MVRMLKLTQRDFKITMINTPENPTGKGGHQRGSGGDVPWGGGHPPSPRPIAPAGPRPCL